MKMHFHLALALMLSLGIAGCQRHVPNAAQSQPADQEPALRLNAFLLSMRGAALLVYLAPPANREGVRRNVFGDR